MMRRIERENTGFMKPGHDLVVAGYAGLAGTRIIAERRYDQLRTWFSEDYLWQILSGKRGQEVSGACDWKSWGATEWEPAGEGGIFTAIWNLSGAYGTGVEFVLRQIPVRQETIEVCERFELNPYRLYSAGCYLLASENGGQMVRVLEGQGVPAVVIGKVNQGIARQILGSDSLGYLERPQPDELKKVIPDFFET